MATLMATTKTIGDEISALILAKLRESYPYMKTDAVKTIAQDSGKKLDEDIKAQEPVMEVSKARSGFMSLSAELRNRVYELALVPQANRDGGRDSSTKIYVGYDAQTRFLDRWSRCEYCDYCVHCGYDVGVSSAYSRPPALLRTSRQVRQEASSIYYGANTFVAWRDSEHAKGFKHHGAFREAVTFLSRVGKEHAGLIERFELHVGTVKGRAHLRKSYSRRQLLALLKPEQYGLTPSAVRFCLA